MQRSDQHRPPHAGLTRRQVGGALLAAPLLGGAAPAGAAPSVAAPAVAEPPLRISWRDAIPDPDPYHNTLRSGFVLAHHVWDTLVYRDPDTFQLKPLLATGWKQESDTDLLLALRAGVRFHDGSAFTADDVLYTVEQAMTDPARAVPSNFDFLAGAEAIDATHVRLKLRQVFPAALEYLAMVLHILPRGARSAAGPAGFARAPIGTGPYRAVQIGAAYAGGLTILERNPDYFDGPKGHPAIPRIEITNVADAASELADLLAGRADWIWQLEPQAAGAVTQDRALTVLRAETMRIFYLGLDAAGRSGPSPLTDKQVRQAIAHGIDRPAIARQLVQNGARALDAPCYPTQFGCDTAVAARYAYDPAAARALLAAAGVPAGFATELVSYVVPAYAAAIQSYLIELGIYARLTELPTAEAEARAAAGRAPLYLGSWGSYSINDVSAMLPHFFEGGPADYTRDGELSSLLHQAGATLEADARANLYRKAIARITEDADWLPLFAYVCSYGMVRKLNFRPFADELPRFWMASWR